VRVMVSGGPVQITRMRNALSFGSSRVSPSLLPLFYRTSICIHFLLQAKQEKVRREAPKPTNPAVIPSTAACVSFVLYQQTSPVARCGDVIAETFYLQERIDCCIIRYIHLGWWTMRVYCY